MVDDLQILKPFFSIFSFIFGTVFGSFFNVCISRIPKNESLIPDSHCPNCNYQIKFYDNIPLLSYLILRGKCRNCGLKISLQYPLVELISGLLFLGLFLKFGISLLFLKYLIFFSFLLIIFFIDFQNMIIPDVLSLPLIILGFLFSVIPNLDINWSQSLFGGVVGFSFFYVIALIFQKVTKKDGMGGGDIKLIASIGTFIGLVGVLFTVIASSILFIVFFVLTQQRKENQIPYGPFLAMGSFLHLFWGNQIWDWYIDFSFNLLDKLG
ncbi:MAG: prepilin peptidase [Candidatus Cloacimonadota bacterium]|nr:prepilin peptidase [Candidatus Cloacimonadota bacterium]